jgi:integrase
MSKRNPIKRYKIDGNALYKVSVDVCGVKLRKQGFISRRAAMDWVVLAEASVIKGQFVPERRKKKKSVSLVKAVGMFREKGGASIMTSTMYGYEIGLRAFSGFVGSIRMDEVNERKVNAFVGYLEGKGLKGATVYGYVAGVRALVKFAFQMGLIDEVPVVSCSVKKDVKNSFLHLEEVENIIDYVENELETWDRWLANFIAVCFYCFLRQGEARAILKGDVNLVNGTICINKTIQRVDGSTEALRDGTKNEKYHTSYSVPPQLLPYLRRQMMMSPGPFLFPNRLVYVGVPTKQQYKAGRRRGTVEGYRYGRQSVVPFVETEFMSSAQVGAAFRRVRKLMGLEENLTSHTLRKSAISHCLNNGMPIKSLEYQARVSAKVLLTTYSQVDKRDIEAETMRAFSARRLENDD